MKNSIAICPGSFDPITMGHLDIISRSSPMFDKVIVVVMSNVHKNSGSFNVEERIEMIKKSVAHLPNIEVDYFDGLLADYAAKKNAKAIVKGLRQSRIHNRFCSNTHQSSCSATASTASCAFWAAADSFSS